MESVQREITLKVTFVFDPNSTSADDITGVDMEEQNALFNLMFDQHSIQNITKHAMLKLLETSGINRSIIRGTCSVEQFVEF